MFNRIKDIIIDQLKLPVDTVIRPDSTFDQMEIDSIDGVEIIMAIEDEFEVEFPDEVAENLKSVADIMNYLTSIGVE